MSLSNQQLAKPLKVVKRIQETDDAVSLVLEIPETLKSKYHYQAGQFVTFFLNVDGQQLNRSYSLSSSPIVDQEFKVTIKKVPGGRGSNYLCHQVHEGDSLMTTPPAGHFFKPSVDAGGCHYFLFAAGSGITPIFSIMKTVLSASALNHVTLVYCNRDEDSVIYAKEIQNWMARLTSRLEVVNVFSKPKREGSGYNGRLQRGLISEILDMPATAPSKREYYLCGPREFMNTVQNSLIELGVAREHIREEDFALGLQSKKEMQVNESWTFIGDSSATKIPEKIIATINGETLEVNAKAGQSILETLLEAGAQPPYSCMDGACMACMAKIQEGQVYQEDPGILTDENIEQREALTCQAKPLSKVVKLTYENF